MRPIALFLLALCLSLPAVAERKQRFGDLDVHYIAFNSGFLQPDIAAAAGLIRSKTQGVVNVAVRKDGKPVNATLDGEVKNLLGKVHRLHFRPVHEAGTVYYLAQFPFESREVLRFSIQLKTADDQTHTLDFNQEMFPDP